MTPTIVARHFAVSDELRRHVDKCAARLPRFLDNFIGCHVALSVEKHRRLAEVTASVSGHTLIATAESDSLYASIDEAFDKLTRQIKKQSERQSYHRPAGRKAPLASQESEDVTGQ